MRTPESRLDAAHVRVWELLPWFVNGTLGARAEQRVRRHLKNCLTCRQEVIYSRALQQTVLDSDALELAPERGCENVMRRIRAGSPTAAPRRELSFWERLSLRIKAAHPWAEAVVAVQVMVLLGVVIALLLPRAARYSTVAAPDEAAPVLCVETAEGVGADRLLAVMANLDGAALRATGRPGVYQIELPAGAPTATVAGVLEMADRHGEVRRADLRAGAPWCR